MTEVEYVEYLEQMRQERDRQMVAHPRNWLALAGLFWLQQGDNWLGSDQINLPGLPEKAGLIRISGDGILLEPQPGSTLTVNGQPPVSQELHSDDDDQADILTIGSIQMMVIKRGAQLLLRVWDTQSDVVKHFSGLKYYPVKPEYRITAKYTRYDPPHTHKSLDAIGTEGETSYVGQASFRWMGVDCTLEAEDDGEDLLFNFSDLTRADATYPAGRRISVPVPQGDTLVLDFNQALNWPCAYTPYATCPLPPKQNALPVRMEAGELRFHD